LKICPWRWWLEEHSRMMGMTVCYSLHPFCTYVLNLSSHIFCAGDLWWKMPMSMAGKKKKEKMQNGDWSQREKTETKSIKELYCSLPIPPQMHNWEGREQASGTNGNKDCYEAPPQRLTKTAPSSFLIALLLNHLILISFQTASPWNSWHLKCPRSGNKLKTYHKMVKDTSNNQDFSFSLSKSYTRRFMNFHHNTGFPQGKRFYFLETCKKWLEKCSFQ